MGMMTGNALFSISAGCGQKIMADGVDIDASKSSCRSVSRWRHFSQNRRTARNSSKTTDWVKYEAPVAGVDNFCVLLVGNEQSVQSIRITLSSHLGLAIEYLEARSGNISLQLIGRGGVDLIVFGEGIEDMDGLEFLERLNQKCGTHKIPVIEILRPEALKTGVQAMKMGAHDYLIKDAGGEYFEMLPILVSRIYAEKQTMNLLRQTAGVHQTISDSIPSVIYQLSLQGGQHDVRISPQILELGLSSEQWGNDAELHHQLCYGEDRPVVRKALEHSYKTGAAFQCEYRINILGDTLRWFHDKAKVVMDKYGRPLFLQGVMTDITGIKSLELEILHYRNRIEAMVRERTERLDRRISILESCNSSLGENYHKMHQMYQELLHKNMTYECEVEGGGVA